MSSMSNGIQAVRPRLYQLHIAFLALAAFLLPLKIHYCNIATGVSFGFWLLSISPQTFKQSRTTYAFYWIIISLYIIQILGLPYSDNLRRGLFMLETKLGLLLFPTMILLNPMTNLNIQRVLTAFIVGVLLACLCCHGHSIYSAASNGISVSDFFLSERFHNDLFTAPIKMHPAYLSLCISIIFFHIVDVRMKGSARRTLWLTILAYLSLCLFVLMSRAALIAFGAGLFIYVVAKVVYLQRSYVKGALLLGAFIVACIAFLSFVPDFRIRMAEMIENIQKNVDTMEDNSTTLHIRQWYCAWSSISGSQLIWGLGTGDEVDALMQCYIAHNFEHLIQKKLDAHNEYLSSLLRHGMIGVFVFLATLFSCLFLAFKEKDMQFLVFIVMIAIHALAVSILYGQASLVIFALFISLFVKALINKKEKIAHSI